MSSKTFKIKGKEEEYIQLAKEYIRSEYTFIRRIGVRILFNYTALTDLTEEELVRVLTEPEDAITKEYQMLLEKDGIPLTYENDALKEIAKVALAKKTGARGLRSILEDIMLDIMYTLPDNKDTVSKCVITEESIHTKKPKIIKKRQKRKNTATATESRTGTG